MSIKILTIDDSKTIRMIIGKVFKPYDCVILEGANGVEGLAVAARERPDLILLDYSMPIMDGYETLTKLRSDPDMKLIPVIMLTAEAGRETVMRIAKLGVRDYIVKPFKEDLITEKVSRVVSLKAKTEAEVRLKRFDDPIGILVVDDKPAIIDQIRNGLSDTVWKITGASQAGEAFDCTKKGFDLILISLSLPNEDAYTLFHTLRRNPATKSTPIFALSVKTATEEQVHAQQAGMLSIITKPIDFEDLKAKVCRTLGLDTSYKYFQQRDGALLLTLPKELSQGAMNEILPSLRKQLNNAVDSGIDKVIIDLSRLVRADIGLIRLVLDAIQSCNELSLKHALVGSPAVVDECRNYQECQGWSFAPSIEEGITRLSQKLVAA